MALLNPLRSWRFAQEDLRRAKTDSIDALGIACFAAQKRPVPTLPFDEPTNQLREYVRFFDRLTQDYGDRVRQLHRLVHLCFPEFTRHVRDLSGPRATAILAAYPTAEAFSSCCLRELASLRYDECSHRVGPALARTLIEVAKVSVGRHHGPAYGAEMVYLCEDLDRQRGKLRELHDELERRIVEHDVGSLLMTITGLGTATVSRIVAAVGDPARFRDSAAFAAYAGAVPGTYESGLYRGNATLCPLGSARLRRSLYMTTLGAVRRSPWLKVYYERLRARGKRPKVALVAAMRKLLTAVYSVAKHRRPFELRLATTDVSSESAPD